VTAGSWLLPVLAGLVIFGSMAIEAARSAANERALVAIGGRQVADPSYPWMQVIYPGGFLAVCLEGWWRGLPVDGWVAAGIAVFAAGKALKWWAIVTLGQRWSFRVFILPGAPLVVGGPYRWLQHPNYVGLVGEIAGSALWMRAPIAGTLFAVTFGIILYVRIAIEERALGLAPRA
jgi:methyltransferase